MGMTFKKKFLTALDDSWITDTDQGTTIALELWDAYIEPLASLAERITQYDPTVLTIDAAALLAKQIHEEAVKALSRCGFNP
jgi:hypothetical protein